VKIIVTAYPRLRGGPKTIEFAVQDLAATVISGEVQIR
jgi:hypothetical protein